MNSTHNPGKVAGFWYLLLILIGGLRLIYIPNKLFVDGNAAATVSNINAHEWLFRFGILGDLLGAVILVLMVLALFRLFKGVDQNLAVQVVIFGGVLPAFIYLVNGACDLATLMVARGSCFLSAFDPSQRDEIAMLFVRLYDHLFTASEILARIWLWPLALLVYRSRFLPRFLGVWLAIGGLGYVILCFTTVLAPQYSNRVFLYSQPAFFGEIAFMLWLLIKGARPPLETTGSSRWE
jgi:Domain of unknown function (DUF4386)